MKTLSMKNDFRWRDQSGNFHNPNEMETRHLFYTLRMIWNHTMPENLRITSYIAHEFIDFYSATYMSNAVKAIGRELLTRNDIKLQWRNELDFMASHFIDRPVSIGELAL